MRPLPVSLHHSQTDISEVMDRKQRNRLIAATIVVISVAVLAIGGYFLLLSKQAQGKHEAKLAWDNGVDHPEAAAVVRDNRDVSTFVPQTLESVNSYWDSCYGRACLSVDVGHYPIVFNLESLAFDDGCVITQQKTPVGSLRVASTKGGGRYKLIYDSTGTRITICVSSTRHNKDQLILWSEDLAATR